MSGKIEKSLNSTEIANNGYLLLAILVTLNTLNFIDRALISSFANFIVPELGLTNTQYGLLTGFVFLVFYSVMGLFMGFLADNVNRARLIAGALCLWSILTALSGTAKGFVSLAIPRAFIGIGESALAPAALSLLADKFSLSKLGFASSVYYLGYPVGSGLSFVIAGNLGPVVGWRNCFYILGAIGVAMSLVMLLVKDPFRHRANINERGVNKKNITNSISFKETSKQLWAVIKRSASLQYIIIASVLTNLLVGAVAFDQLWLVQERGFERAEIARITGWMFVIAGILGSLYGAYVMDYCYRRFLIPKANFIFWSLLILAPLSYMYRLSDPGSIGFWLGLGSGFFMFGAYIGPFFTIVQELTPVNLRATMIALTILLSNVIGLGFGNLFCGMMIDWLIVLEVSEPYTLSLLILTLVSHIGLFFFFMAGKKDQCFQPNAPSLIMQE